MMLCKYMNYMRWYKGGIYLLENITEPSKYATVVTLDYDFRSLQIIIRRAPLTNLDTKYANNGIFKPDLRK